MIPCWLQLRSLQPAAADHQARQALVADQQVGASSDEAQWQLLLSAPMDQGFKLLAALGFCEEVGSAAHLPGGEVPRERLAAG